MTSRLEVLAETDKPEENILQDKSQLASERFCELKFISLTTSKSYLLTRQSASRRSPGMYVCIFID